MRYDQLRHVRIYVEKTPEYLRAGWLGRTVFWHLHSDADATGRFEVKQGEEYSSIAYRMDLPAESFRVGIERLLELDLVRWEPSNVTRRDAATSQHVTFSTGGALLIVDYVEAQNVKLSDALRARNYRMRRSLAKDAAKRKAVTLRDAAKSRDVTKLERVTVAQAKERGLLSRTLAARLLGMSMATLRRREGNEIMPLMTELGEFVFRESDVMALAAKTWKEIVPAPAPEREPPAEPSGSPIWVERAARLIERMGDESHSTAEMLAIGRRAGLKASDVEETLIAREGEELRKVDGKWSAVNPVKAEK